MTKFIILYFFILFAGWAHAQTVINIEKNPGTGNSLPQSAHSPQIENNKTTMISSAARRSSIHQANDKGKVSSPQNEKQAANVKSIAQARRPSTAGRPVQINIPVIPAPGIAKPNRMSIPNRRISLPVGK